MKWKKLGKIFDPTQHQLTNNCFEFAQSPQALVFDNFVRIYFSTRETDIKNGKYLSHISYIEMDKEFKKILFVSNKQVIALGGLGTFDEHGIFPINVLRDKDKIIAYTCGWNRRVSTSVETSVGYAISNDNGESFQKIGNGPILTASPNEPFLVGDAFVSIINNTYHMWYIFGTKWIDNNFEESARVYKIGCATSLNGIDWIKNEGNQIIPDKLNQNECQALPSVLFANNTFHMVFCYREALGFRKDKDKGYKLGYAFSKDNVKWTRDDEALGLTFENENWDSDMQCYPHIFTCNNKTYLLYNGNEFGKHGFGIAVLEEF